jgi:hypothetical protein
MSPLALDVSETFPASLESDAGKPEAERPAFHFHYLSSRGYRDRRKLLGEWNRFYEQREKKKAQIAEALKGGDPANVAVEQLEASNATLPEYEKLLERTYAALEDQCDGWENIRIKGNAFLAYQRSFLDTVLNDSEARELADTTCRMNRLQVAEKKDSGSPSSGEPAKSALAAAPSDASASQSQTDSPLTAPPAEDATPSAPSAAGKTGS